MAEPIPRPRIRGDYIPIYRPEADIYEGVNTQDFTFGTRYPEWIVNDFSILRYQGAWHMVGITHPRPPKTIDAFHYDRATSHEAEFQLFHASAEAESFHSLLRPGSFREEKKILYPSARPGERNEIWAPHLMAYGGGVRIIYSPGQMRCADSRDFIHWETGITLFTAEHRSARDPYLFEENGVCYLLYVVDQYVRCRISRDHMESWEPPFTVYENPFRSALGMEYKAAPESPFLMKRGDYYYLFWCLYDAYNGGYDNRTFVFAAESIDGFLGKAPVAVLEAHAPEIVEDDGETFILSAFHPQNGINAAELVWE